MTGIGEKERGSLIGICDCVNCLYEIKYQCKNCKLMDINTKRQETGCLTKIAEKEGVSFIGLCDCVNFLYKKNILV